MKKGCLVCAQITLFRAKFGMCANHALSGKIWYVHKSRSFGEIFYVRESRCFGRNTVCTRIMLFRAKYGMYVRESRSFGRNMVCARITLFRAKYLIENLGWHQVKIIILPWMSEMTQKYAPFCRQGVSFKQYEKCSSFWFKLNFKKFPCVFDKTL